VLANSEGWRRLLTGSRRPAGCGRRSGRYRDHHGDHCGNGLILFVVLIVLVVIDNGDDSDLDVDLLGVVQFDGTTFEDLRRGGIGLVRFGVDRGIDGFFRHSGSYVTDG
jgi:hypothetical protein